MSDHQTNILNEEQGNSPKQPTPKPSPVPPDTVERGGDGQPRPKTPMPPVLPPDQVDKSTNIPPSKISD